MQIPEYYSISKVIDFGYQGRNKNIRSDSNIHTMRHVEVIVALLFSMKLTQENSVRSQPR